MELETNDLEESIEFFDWRGVQRLMKVPRRFRSPDVEIEFGLWHVKRGDSFFSKTIVFCIVGLAISGLLLWEDFIRFEHFAPASSWMIVGWSFMSLFAVSLYIIRRVRPTFFTERRKIACALLVIVFYHITGNRAAVVSYLGIAWSYSGHQPYPQQIWSVVILMIVVSVICNAAFSRCSISWVVYPASLIISVGFSVPHLVAGHVVLSQVIAVQVLILIHVHTVFFAQATAELAERLNFMHVVLSKKVITQERVLRYTAERLAEDVLPPTVRQGAADTASTTTSKTAGISSMAFHMLHNETTPQSQEVSLQAISVIGQEEHWLIEPEDLHVLPTCMLGVGGFGGVVAGIWKQAQVAVKVPAERGGRHRNAVAPELRILRKLRHPNIVSFIGACIPSHLTCLIVEELVIGETLSNMFAQLGAFALENSQLRQHIILDISAALQYLHGQEPAVTHGDLTPGNVLVEYKTCKMKLTDFGLSCRENSRDVRNGGTPNWQEPVLRSRDRASIEVHTSADIWALGAVSFFICSGLAPPQGSCISGSSSFEEFGSAVQHLWAGPSAELKSPKHNKIELIDPEDLEACRSLCIDCMSPDRERRPTACSVHERVRTWNQRQPRSWLGCGQQADKLPADLAEVHEHARELRSSRTKKMQLPKDVCGEIYEELLAQAQRLRALPGLKRSSDVVQLMHLVLEMVSWKMQERVCL